METVMIVATLMIVATMVLLMVTFSRKNKKDEKWN